MKQGEPGEVKGRRSRAHTRPLLRDANVALNESLRLAHRGDCKGAERVMRLAERQAKLAAHLFDLNAELKHLATARRTVEAQLSARFDAPRAEPETAPIKANWLKPPDAPYPDPIGDWSARDPRVQALFAQGRAVMARRDEARALGAAAPNAVKSC